MLKLLGLAALAALAAANPVDLDEGNAADYIGADKAVFVKFFAPWCGHCKAMKEDYIEVSKIFKPTDPVVIAEANCDEHKDLCSKYGVSGYPTLKFFPAKSTEAEAYQGGRTAEDIISFVNSKVGTARKLAKAPSSLTHLDDSNFDAVMFGTDIQKTRLVAFVAPWCGHCKAAKPHLEKTAAAFEGDSKVTVATVDADKHRSLGERFEVKGFPTIKVFKAGSREPEDYNGARDTDAFVTFLNKEAGSFRTADGGVTAEAGRLAAFDDLAVKFAKALSSGDKDGASAALSQAKTDAAALETADEKQKADQYVKVMSKAVEKGFAWIAKEAKRLTSMANAGTEGSASGVSRAKRADFLTRANVLNAFQAE